VLDGGRMFERFTERARHVVVLAQEEARRLQHNYIGTEHILLGLLGEPDGVAYRALESFGMSLDETRDEVKAIVGAGSHWRAHPVHPSRKEDPRARAA
jgi:ATP-dependent Clp protease ATP-binding subunit ClpA